MSNKQALQVFEHYKVRTIWDEESQKWYFSVVDVCGVLTDSPNPQLILKTKQINNFNIPQAPFCL